MLDNGLLLQDFVAFISWLRNGNLIYWERNWGCSKSLKRVWMSSLSCREVFIFVGILDRMPTNCGSLYFGVGPFFTCLMWPKKQILKSEVAKTSWKKLGEACVWEISDLSSDKMASWTVFSFKKLPNEGKHYL